jgi:hypothetical protein
MSGVISFRTDKMEELKKLAQDEGLSLSKLTAHLVEEYLDFYLLNEKYRMVHVSELVISIGFELLDESDLKKLNEAVVLEAVQSIKTMTNDFSFYKILQIILVWCRYNSLDIERFDEKGFLKLVCKNKMPKNWNIFVSRILIGIFKSFGFEGAIISVEKGLFSIKLEKEKIH